MIYITLILCGGILGFIINLLINRKTIRNASSVIKLNENILAKNNQLKEELQNLQITLASLNAKKNELQGSIIDLESQAKQTGEIFLKQNLDLAKEKLDRAAEELSNDFQKQSEEYMKDYLEVLSECGKDLNNEIKNKKETLNLLTLEITSYKNKIDAIIEEFKRTEEKRIKKDFYKLILTPIDIKEIEILREATQSLRNPEPVNKIIWKVYYEKPYTDLVGRVIGQGVHCGIYKITNLKNQMCYVGQSTNISERWKQHIKRGIGAEAQTRNKLYPAMLSFGVENFSFEILQECSSNELNSLEKYWQEFYQAMTFGYSIK